MPHALIEQLEKRLAAFEIQTLQRFDFVDSLLGNRAEDVLRLEDLISKIKPGEGAGPVFSLKNDKWILNQCVELNQEGKPALIPPDRAMIHPFVGQLVSEVPVTVVDERTGEPRDYKERRISYGLSSFGYDVTLAPVFKVFSAVTAGDGPSLTIIDPKNFDPRCFVLQRGDYVILPPKSFMLGVINEYVRMPKDILAICFNKSTYARCGINVSTTIMEPGWHGNIVLEINNMTPLPAKIYANEGIAQLAFFQGNAPHVDYGKRSGKYQGQTGVQTAL